MSVTVAELRQAHALAAEVVATHSERYAPLFEVLDNELKRREARQKLIDQTAGRNKFTEQRARRRKRRKTHQVPNF